MQKKYYFADFENISHSPIEAAEEGIKIEYEENHSEKAPEPILAKE